MKVLYVNHTAVVGGGERSLLELLSGLSSDVRATLACPQGDLAAAARRLGLPVTTIPAATPSFRLDLAQTPRGIMNLARAALAVGRAARRVDADLVHANSIRAGLIAMPLARFGGPPVVVHVRDCLSQGRVAELTRRVIGSSAAFVLTNSKYTAARFAPNASPSPLRTVYNSVDLTAFDPTQCDRVDARARLGLEPGVAALGVIAQITPWKAQDDAIRTLAALRRRGLDARLLLVGGAKFASGSETFDNEAFERSLHALVRELRIEEAVSFLGERADVPQILCALDLVLVPSWEEPFGRSVIEALAMETAVVATSVGGPAEIVTDGVDGILLAPRDPESWAEAAARLLKKRDALREMGKAGRRTAVVRFSRETHVQEVLAAYRQALNGSAR